MEFGVGTDKHYVLGLGDRGRDQSSEKILESLEARGCGRARLKAKRQVKKETREGCGKGAHRKSMHE